ncbi:MAG: HNH endonuclease, partial [Candidatus Omnitrophota bacterium]
LCIHHIDGNGKNVSKKQKNNDIDNLITLCYFCHKAIHSYN